MDYEPTQLDVTLAQFISHRAAQLPERELLVDPYTRYTFREFEAEMMRAARGAIAAGVTPGDRIGVWAPNTARWLIAAFGCSAAGAVIAPMNTRYKGVEAAYAVGAMKPRLLFTTRAFLGLDAPRMLRGALEAELDATVVVLDASAEAGDLTWEEFLTGGDAITREEAAAQRDSISPLSPSDIILTSGTTGAPKGVVMTHRQNMVAYDIHNRHLGFEDGERTIVTLPFFHSFGLKAGFLLSVILGGTVFCDEIFDPAQLAQTIERERVSYLPGTPTVFSSLLNDPSRKSFDLSSLRRCFVAGSALSEQLVARIQDELGIDVYTGYGLSELVGAVSLTPPGASAERVSKWAGKVVEGVAIRVVDADGHDLPYGQPGEILARSACIMTGYLDDPVATAAAIDDDGWLHTGDICVADAEGWIKVVDRKKEMFIVGGLNAYPAEIEAYLLRHPDIAQVAVIGVPDERLGEVGAAFVVPAAGRALTPKEVVSWSRRNISNYKVPRHVVVVDSLPMNASMKVLKSDLRALLAAEAARRPGPVSEIR